MLPVDNEYTSMLLNSFNVDPLELRMSLQKVAELLKKMLNMTIARKTKTCRLSRKVLTAKLLNNNSF